MTIPSEWELFDGKVCDPKYGRTEIQKANQVIDKFVEDVAAGRLASATLPELEDSAEVLRKYAGYPGWGFYLDEFFSRQAGKSYTETARVLRQFADDLNALILSRLEAPRFGHGVGSSARHGPDGVPPDPDRDVPF